MQSRSGGDSQCYVSAEYAPHQHKGGLYKWCMIRKRVCGRKESGNIKPVEVVQRQCAEW
jgi:hypothetical protein